MGVVIKEDRKYHYKIVLYIIETEKCLYKKPRESSSHLYINNKIRKELKSEENKKKR